VSAAITAAGVTRQLVDLIDAGELTPIVSPTLLVELTEVLRRDKFRPYLKLDTALRFITELERLAETWDDPDEVVPVSTDRDDDYLIALSRLSQADALVSGDTDLTHLACPTCGSSLPESSSISSRPTRSRVSGRPTRRPAGA
jgi:putative PIN family toxin of toxin-antitoxin system